MCCECREFPKTFEKSKKKLCVTILKINSLPSLHLARCEMNSRYIDVNLLSTLTTLAVTHLRRGNIKAVQGYLYFGSVDHTDKKQLSYELRGPIHQLLISQSKETSEVCFCWCLMCSKQAQSILAK